MNLSKKLALDLVKILSHYQTLVDDGVADAHGLCNDLEDFILGNDEDDDDNTDEGEDDEEDARDESESEDVGEEEDEEESDEQEDEESDASDDEGAEVDKVGLVPDADAEVAAGDLHDLKPIKGKIIASSSGEVDESVTLEFEHDTEHDTVDLLLDGMFVGPLFRIKRTGDELHVLDGSYKWHRFSVNKYPKDWQHVLPASKLLSVSEE